MTMCDAMSRWFPSAPRLVEALVLVGAFAFPAAGEEIPIPPSFLAEVGANFQQWDLDGDGTLSLEETTRLVPQPSFRDASAAALAAVHFAQRSVSPRATAFTRGLLLEVPSGAGERSPPFEFYYATGLAQIRKTERRLFATEAPSLRTIRQGRLGDCYFLATLGAMLNRNPKDVARFIRPRSDGTFAVRFADGKQITIRPLTDAEIALGSSADQQGLWLNVLEKAYGAIVEIAELRRGIVENALDAIGDGGDPSTAMGRLTGHDAGLLRFRPEGPDAVPDDLRVEGFLPVLRSRLLTQQRSGLIACCATAKVNVPLGMAREHLYAILDFDAARDVVLLWNPWGNHFEPKGTPGTTSGYRVRQGQFSVPLADFIRIFERLVYETDREVSFDSF
jgi:hypothetical protein